MLKVDDSKYYDQIGGSSAQISFLCSHYQNKWQILVSKYFP
jgi:hypothetical protein